MDTEKTSTWLPLADYSMKHKVSVSTLRRRIKAEDIQFKFNEGKYLLLDNQKSSENQEHRPSLKSDAAPVQIKNAKAEVIMDSSESVITAANRLLADLKKAYTQILQEKEQTILRLNHDGSLDTTFKTGEGFDSTVHVIVEQDVNKMLVAGKISDGKR